MKLIDWFRAKARAIIRRIAKILNKMTNGNIHPDVITVIGMVMHVPIAILIATGQYIAAAVLLILFGLFDTLDGELARLQGKSSARGMVLDASTDRIKETILYTGITYLLATGAHPQLAALSTAACGISLSVSYVKAKGEAAFALHAPDTNHETLNRIFKDGLVTFELRMVLIIIGLFTRQTAIIAGIITLLATFTFFQRLIKINRTLRND